VELLFSWHPAIKALRNCNNVNAIAIFKDIVSFFPTFIFSPLTIVTENVLNDSFNLLVQFITFKMNGLLMLNERQMNISNLWILCTLK